LEEQVEVVIVCVLDVEEVGGSSEIEALGGPSAIAEEVEVVEYCGPDVPTELIGGGVEVPSEACGSEGGEGDQHPAFALAESDEESDPPSGRKGQPRASGAG
jgi:hypothetical protein